MGFAEGQIISHYRIIRRLEVDPTLESYLAEDTVLSREVIVTTHPPVADPSSEKLADLRQTVKAIASLSHANLIPVFEAIETEGYLLVISEHIKGTRLDHLMTQGALSLNGVLDIIIQTCSGLSAAHGLGIAHGSLDPTTIYIDHEGRAQLAAFVRARIRCLATAQSSPAHDSAVRAAGGDADSISAANDIAAIGKILQKMVGEGLGGSRPSVRAAIADSVSVPASELSGVVARATGESETAGYSTAEQMLEDLRRIRAEISLHRSGDQVREVFEDAAVGLYRTTPEGRLIMANPALLRMLGYDSLDELSSINIEASGYQPGYSRAEFRKLIEQDGIVTGLESEWVGKNGRRVFVRESSRAIEDRSGKTLYYEGIVEDITEHKHIQDAYRTLVDRSLQGLMIWQDSHMVFVNQTFADMLGYSAEELLAMPPGELPGILDPEQRDRILRRMQDRLSGVVPPDRYEFSGRRKDGSTFWMEVYASRTQFAGRPAIQGAFIDITERKYAEQALKLHVAQLQDFVRHAPVAVAMFDDEVRYIAASERWIDDYRLTDRNVIGRSHYDVFPGISERWKAIHRRCLKGSVEKCDEERFERADGSINWIRWEILPWRTADNRIGGLIMFSEDISERKQADDLLKYRLEFKQLITTISSEFINLRSEQVDRGIEDALAMIGRFAGVDRSHVFLVSEDGQTAENTHEWCAEGIAAQRQLFQGIDVRTVPWIIGKLRQFENVHIPSLQEWPAEASAERALMEKMQVQSFIAVPMHFRDKLLGFVGFDSVRGEKRWSEEAITLLQIVGQIFTSALERKWAEDRLRRGEAYYRAVVEDQTELICRYRPDMTLTFVNQACCRFFGKSREELIDTQFSDLMPDDERDRVSGIIRGLSPEQSVATIEHRVAAVSGETFWLQWTNRALFDQWGQLISYQSVGRDLTGRKRMEEMLRITTRELKADRQSLTEKNVALKQVLDYIEKERQDYKQRICQDVETAIAPFLTELKSRSGKKDDEKIKALETDLASILTRDIDVFRDRYASLTAREIQVCELIKQGYSSKQISDKLNLSLFTVHKHRELIRRKLHIRNKSVNLSTYLKTH